MECAVIDPSGTRLAAGSLKKKLEAFEEMKEVMETIDENDTSTPERRLISKQKKKIEALTQQVFSATDHKTLM